MQRSGDCKSALWSGFYLHRTMIQSEIYARTTVTTGFGQASGLRVCFLRRTWAGNFAETTQLLCSTYPSLLISLSIKLDSVLKHFHRHSPPVCVQPALALRWTPSVPLHYPSPDNAAHLSHVYLTCRIRPPRFALISR